MINVDEDFGGRVIFEKTADNGLDYIATAFTNASGATLGIRAGEIALQNGGTLGGTINGAGMLDLFAGTCCVTEHAVAAWVNADWGLRQMLRHAGRGKPPMRFNP